MESYRCGRRSWHAILQARKAFRSLKRVQRLQAFTHRNSVQKQATNTWSHVQSWSKMQAAIRARRAAMVAEGRFRQKKHDNRSKLDAKLHDPEVKFISLYVSHSMTKTASKAGKNTSLSDQKAQGSTKKPSEAAASKESKTKVASSARPRTKSTKATKQEQQP
ncbi:hypothetical protein BHM03_00032346 [Ensete ventricosum]|nr:hypothetical protein BHM03_00032346 [Ensete ventricosum]